MVNPNDYIAPFEEAKPGYEVSAVYELKSGYVYFLRLKGVDDYMGGTTIPFVNKNTGKISIVTMYDIVDEWKTKKLVYSIK